MRLSTSLLALATCPQQLSAFSLNNRNFFRQQTTFLNSATQSSEENFVDKAPCYDSVCATFTDENENENGEQNEKPPSPEPLGQAIQRLGIATGPTVWSEFGRIAQENPDIANLGQGFPDWLPPQFAIDALVEGATDVSHNSPHQYTRTAGHPKLVKELAGRYSRHLGREIDPFGEVAITIGASQALYLALQTLVKPGDEVIVFEPFFDLYLNQIKLAGGIPKFVPLTFKPYDDTPGVITSGEWILEPEKLHEQISDKTRAIILNSPHNPTGKIFTRTEMTMIADAVRDRCGENTVVLSDEVYKYIVHAPPKDEIEEEEAQQFQNASSTSDGLPNSHADGNDELKYKPAICQGHVHFATLPGMEDRTITISSAGKTFSATGWQVGWAIGPEKYIASMHQLLPYVQFCASTVIQEALARALPKADLPYEGYANYYEHLKAMYTRKRDLLGPALKDAGFAVPDYNVTPGGGFFIFARIGKEIAESIPKEKLMAYNAAAPGNVARQDFALCQWMAEEKGVLCIPASPFFSEDCEKGDDGEPLSDQFVRIAFCKTNDTIKLAAANLM
eukprot:CAMPEP_0194078658 /NCGR_PEP_ID=MMETSP0149-20130528/5001_1 /TAXON_ID=122233 /ORGANISM="Chaetoceros debilis, Strain MM31A-1" /LENGTH=562 /DNA_ID=CAMNT_0038759961 /DNA_START=98 /DNA_END=1783 /DNA_ORIENTATION=+